MDTDLRAEKKQIQRNRTQKHFLIRIQVEHSCFAYSALNEATNSVTMTKVIGEVAEDKESLRKTNINSN
eukprot:4038963-Amphidinium_carterae.1